MPTKSVGTYAPPADDRIRQGGDNSYPKDADRKTSSPRYLLD
jgi:hypothetical protein